MKKFLSGFLCAVLLLLPAAVPAQAKAPAPAKNFVVLGDSISAGAGAVYSRNAYANRVADTQGYALENFARGGDTSAALLRKVTENHAVRQGIRGADIIAITIGGNDFYPSLSKILGGLLGDTDWVQPRLTELAANFARTIKEIRRLNPKALLIVQTLYNPVFEALPPSAHALYGTVVKGINDVFRGYLEKNPGAYRIADVCAAFEGRRGLVYFDMVHPSALGHSVIAAVVVNTIGARAISIPPPSRTLDFFVRIIRPLLKLMDFVLLGTLRFTRDHLPRAWALV